MASGSAGNVTLVATDRTRVLVDAGLSVKDTFARLAAIGEDGERIDAVVITHEHTDHVGGLPRLVRKFRAKKRTVPVYVTERTHCQIDWGGTEPPVEHFQAGARFTVGDIEIDSFTIPHDAVDPVGFCFRAFGVKFGIVTDLGYVTDSLRHHLRGCHVLLLEANHDLDMLKVGPYPWSVKQRVMSRVGHLSNMGACDFIARDFDRGAVTLILGHLSEHNNHPAIVRLMAEGALAARGVPTNLEIAQQSIPTGVFTF